MHTEVLLYLPCLCLYCLCASLSVLYLCGLPCLYASLSLSLDVSLGVYLQRPLSAATRHAAETASASAGQRDGAQSPPQTSHLRHKERKGPKRQSPLCVCYLVRVQEKAVPEDDAGVRSAESAVGRPQAALP